LIKGTTTITIWGTFCSESKICVGRFHLSSSDTNCGNAVHTGQRPVVDFVCGMY